MATLPIFAQLQPLEKVSHYAPLGIRFWDPAGARVVQEGLEVIARPLGCRGPIRQAYRTLSGVYAFRDLPGLRSVEISDPDLPAGERLPATSPPLPTRFVIEVHDRLGRFLTHTFQVDVPVRGIYPLQSVASPPAAGLPGAFLFSDASRPVLGGMAAIRAQVVERLSTGQRQPAPFAVLRVQAASAAGNNSASWMGIADAGGSAVVYFPYPPFDAVVDQSSPPTTPAAGSVQSWELTLTVQYRAASQRRADAFATLPDLGSLLTQPQAQIWSVPGGPGQSSQTIRLEFARPIILRTAGDSALWVEPLP